MVKVGITIPGFHRVIGGLKILIFENMITNVLLEKDSVKINKLIKNAYIGNLSFKKKNGCFVASNHCENVP